MIDDYLNSKAYFYDLCENLNDMIQSVSPQGKILYVNKSWRKKLGYTNTDIKNINIFDIIDPEYTDLCKKEFKKVLSGKSINNIVVKFIKKDGKKVWVEGNANCHFDEKGKPLFTRGIFRDVTERKNLELKVSKLKSDLEETIQKRTLELELTNKALQKEINSRKLTEKSFKQIIEASPSALLMTNEQGTIQMVNTRIENIFNYKKDELIGKKVEILIPSNLTRKHKEYRKEFVNKPSSRPMGYGRDLIALKKDGSHIPVEIGLSPIKSDAELHILASIIDITQRKNTEKEIKESKEKLSAVMNNTSDAIIEFDDSGNILITNNQASQFFDKSKSQSNNIWEIIPSESTEVFKTILEKAKKGSNINDYETEAILTNGRRKPVSIGLTYSKSGNKNYIVTIRDISESIVLRNKIIDIEKSQIVGKMAEGFAHHMSTPLASILLRVQMLKEDFSANNDLQQYIDKLELIEEQVGYGQKVIQRLLKFVSKPNYEKQIARIVDILKESVEIVKPLLKKNNIDIILDVSNTYIIRCDQNLFQMVISDLIMNSIDAIGKDGQIIVSTLDENNNSNVILKISDTGTGIQKDVLPFVFEPFFTTKTKEKGTGLGLSVAKRVIKEHNGDISIESFSGKGTDVLIKLPLYKEI